MARYIALLRGINVGRNKRVSMADLRRVLERLGYEEVATLLQSGNAVFTAEGTTAQLARQIEGALDDALGMEIKVVVLTEAELTKIVRANPLPKAEQDGSRFVVTFLREKPKALPEVDVSDYAPDEVRFTSRANYIWHHNGISGASKATQQLGQQLGVVHTARNWNTVTKLVEMARTA